MNQWRARSPNEIVWAHFGKDYIAFHRPSGNTHFLNSASHRLLCEILTEAQNLNAIASEFATTNDPGEQVEFLDQMQSLLVHLQKLGLVDCV